MDLVALNRCSITTRVSRTLQPGVEWNAKSIHCLTPAAVNDTTCQVIKLRSLVWVCDMGVLRKRIKWPRKRCNAFRNTM